MFSWVRIYRGICIHNTKLKSAILMYYLALKPAYITVYNYQVQDHDDK